MGSSSSHHAAAITATRTRRLVAFQEETVHQIVIEYPEEITLGHVPHPAMP